MCGIAGIVHAPGSDCTDRVKRGVAALVHRGPDAQVVQSPDGIATLGHARLAIIDLDARSNQPMVDGSGRFTIVYNGEIYNYRQIRTALESLGVTFRTESDTEVVLEAFARWGTGAFGRFDGMFALAIWDRTERKLVLARDRFGEKPLCYAVGPGFVCFASELRALLAMGLIPEKAPSVQALNQYLALGYVLAPLSAHPDIRKVESSSTVTIGSDGSIRTERYWDYADAFRTAKTGSRADLLAELDFRLGQAVRSRLVSDVPVGAFLSGGLDSSLVTAWMRDALPYELHTFSLGFEQPDYDESSDARLVGEALGTVHHEEKILVSQGVGYTRDAVARYDEPFSDTSLVPMVRVAELASRHVKVVLSGDGADELFAGYPTYRADLIMGYARHVPRAFRRLSSRAIEIGTKETALAKTSLAFRLRQFAKGLPLGPTDAHFAWRMLHGVDERIELMGREHADEIRDTCPSRIFARHYADVVDLPLLSRHLYVDAKTWLTDDILVKVDRATMAFSIESRAPFLALDLVEHAAALPPEMKLSHRESKIALRAVARSRLPARTTEKPKSGFSSPLAEWFHWSGENEYRMFNRHVADWRGIALRPGAAVAGAAVAGAASSA